MEAITRNVSDIPADDLPAFEHLLGEPLRSGQQLIVQVLDSKEPSESSAPDPDAPQLPEWFNVYEGLSDEEIDRLEEGFQRLDLTRRRL